MRNSSSAAVAACLLVAFPSAGVAQDRLSDFRLPPDPDATPAQPVQGPVAPDVPSSREIQAVQPSPVPSLATPPTATLTPRIVLPAPETPARANARPSPVAGSAPSSLADGEPAVGPPIAEPTPFAQQSAGAPLRPDATPQPPPSQATAPDEEPIRPLGWLAAALVAIGAAVLALLLRRRRVAAPLTPAPARPRSVSGSAAQPPATAPQEEGLTVHLEPAQLMLTLVRATLSVRLRVTAGTQPLDQLAITADMISAHASLPREQQLCGPDANAMQVACIQRLDPGESHIVTAQLSLPLDRITAIRQGRAALLLPLARFRLQWSGHPPLERVFLVALPPQQPGAGLQPVRLDLGPRLYRDLASRPFA